MTQTIFSDGIRNVPKSFIREILNVISDENMISFAGGLPNPQFFPVEGFKDATEKVLKKHGAEVLQYSFTEGYEPLRSFIAERYWKTRGLKISPDEILITNGSQQAIDLLGKILLNKSDSVLIENPSYLAAIQSLSFYDVGFNPLSLENDGVNLCQMEKALATKNIKFFYSIPNFQNPTGITYSLEKRKAVVKMLKPSKVILIEDDPYGDICFSEGYQNSFRELYENTILLGSFSKIVAPGLRLGWVCAPKKIYEKLYIAKQASDLHSNYFTQRVLFQYLQDNEIDMHIKKIQTFYYEQKKMMVGAIKNYFPKDVSFTDPDGGMFLWITLPERIDALDLFHEAVKSGVAFVPGEPFFVDSAKKNTLRLNFSNVSPDKIREGIMKLGKVLEKF